jgi:hypothetical protein
LINDGLGRLVRTTLRRRAPPAGRACGVGERRLGMRRAGVRGDALSAHAVRPPPGVVRREMEPIVQQVPTGVSRERDVLGFDRDIP